MNIHNTSGMTTYTRRNFLTLGGAVLGGIAVGTTVTAATSTDRFIVDTQDVTTGELTRSDLTVVFDLSEVDLVVVEGDESDVENLDTDYAPDTYYELEVPVEEADRDAESATDEPLYALQWDKQSQRIPEVHGITRGDGTRVAIIDSGVAAGHPDLQHAVNSDLSRNFSGDPYGAPGPWGGYHGTHVAGIVAANDQNEEGVVGSAPGAEIVDCRVFSLGQGASFGSVLAALVYSANIDSDVANLSLGAYPIERRAIGEFYGRVLNRVTTWVNKEGTVIVTSAGNDGADLQHDGGGITCYENDDGEEVCFVHSAFISLPNEAAGPMSISATGPIGFMWGDAGFEEPPESPAFYTNYGTNAIDVGAPGGDADLDAIGSDEPWYLDLVLSTVATPIFDSDDQKGNGKGKQNGKKSSDDGPTAEYGYGWAAGTSMSAPQVSAAAALVRSVDPSLNANQVKSILRQTASVPDGYDKTYYGSGYLDTLGAVQKSQ